MACKFSHELEDQLDLLSLKITIIILDQRHEALVHVRAALEDEDVLSDKLADLIGDLLVVVVLNLAVEPDNAPC